MSGTVVFEDAKLQAVELIAETVTLNNFSVSTATTFQQTTNASNVTTNTLRFTNPATAFVTTGNVEVGTANLFVDTTTGRVGIGSASPGGPLHVKAVGSTTLTNESPITNGIFVYNDQNSANQDASVAIRVAGSSAGDPFLSFDIANEYGWAWGMDNSDGNKMKLGANWHTVSNDTKMTIDTSGNLGVGTPAPDTRLTVSIGDITSSGEIAKFHANYDSANNGYLIIEENNHTPGNNDWTGYGTRIQKKTDSTDQGYIEFNPVGGQYSTAFGNGSTEYMRIEYPDGHVGIGTTAPSTHLHLYEKTGNPGATEGDMIGTHNLTEYLRFTGGGDSGDVNSVSVGFKLGADDNNAVSPDGRLDICANDGAGVGNSYGQIPDKTIATFLGSGNVGIGTTNPDAQLHIGPKDNNHIYLASANNLYGWKLETIDSQSGNVPFKITKRTDGVDTTVLTIKNQDGNVGIGTTNPQNKLDVRSDNYATFGKATYNAAGWSGIRLGTPYTTNHDAYCSVIESYNNHATDYNSILRFKTSNGNNAAATERMRIASNGCIGIGTSDPGSCLLNVQGGAAHFKGNAPGVHIQPVQTTGGGQNLFTGFRTGDSYGRAQLVLSSAYSDVIIASSQVNNNHGSNLSFVTYDPNNSASYRKFVINQGNWGTRKHYLDFGYGDKVDPNPHGYINSTDTVMTLDGVNKRMGIGSITPGYKLSINGSLYYTSGGLNGSDDRIKYNERNISNALTMISQLKPQKYEKIMEFPGEPIGTWIPTDEEWENVKEDYKYDEEFGFIAQDVRKIPELSFLVHGEETRMDTKTVSQEEYSNLSTEEQVTFTHSYTDGTNTITQEEYSNIEPTEQEVYVQQYTKQMETETPLGLNYQGLFVVAISAIQELKLKNDALEARIAAIENA